MRHFLLEIPRIYTPFWQIGKCSGQIHEFALSGIPIKKTLQSLIILHMVQKNTTLNRKIKTK